MSPKTEERTRKALRIVRISMLAVVLRELAFFYSNSLHSSFQLCELVVDACDRSVYMSLCFFERGTSQSHELWLAVLYHGVLLCCNLCLLKVFLESEKERFKTLCPVCFLCPGPL